MLLDHATSSSPPPPLLPPFSALMLRNWWKATGIVTGGLYESANGCQPYTIAACDHHEPGPLNPCSSSIEPTPECSKTCETGYTTPYTTDKHMGSSAYSVSASVAAIQTEIMTNGPVEGAFDVYSDFLTYKSGMLVQAACTAAASDRLHLYRCLSAYFRITRRGTRYQDPWLGYPERNTILARC